MIDHKENYKKFEEIFNLDAKHTFLSGTQGLGKTNLTEAFALNNYRNSMCLKDNHRLVGESHNRINDHMNFGLIKVPPLPLTKIGKGFDMSIDKLYWDIYGYHNKKYLCPRYRNPFINSLNKYGYSLISCKDCEEKYDCDWFNHNKNQTWLRSHNKNYNGIWLIVKSYFGTGVINKLLDKQKDYLKINLMIIDEPIYELMFKQIKINGWLIKDYIRFIDDIIDRFTRRRIKIKEFIEIWKDEKKVLEVIQKYTTKKSSLSEAKIKKEITDEIHKFHKMWGVGKLNLWNYQLKLLLTKKYRLSEYITNVNNFMVEIMDDVKRIKFKNKIITRIYIDRKKYNFHYIINRKYLFDELFNRDIRFIFTDAQATKDKVEKFFDFTTDDYELLEIIYPEQFKIIRKYMQAEGKKYRLWKDKEYTELFDTFVNMINKLLLNRKDKLIVIFCFKKFIKELRSRLKKTVERYKIDVKYNHYFYSKGVNLYEDRDVGIILGSSAKPTEYVKILANNSNFSVEDWKFMFGPEVHQDCWGRLRAINRPGEIELLYISSVYNPFLPKYVPLNFWEENNNGLINFIRNNIGCKADYIHNNYFNRKVSYERVRTLLNQGRDYGILIPYFENKPPGNRGRKSNLWRLNIYV